MKTPGFIDLQVNGYKGVDFSSSDLTEDKFCFACEELLKTGTAAFMPTLITSSKEVYENNLPIIAKVKNSGKFGNQILGIHLEGPFISDQPGAVGAHPKQFTQKPSIEAFDKLWSLSEGSIKILTVAAELEGAEELAKYAVSKGVVVSLGHQLATNKAIDKLAKAGAKTITHLGNGVPNQLDRHDNPILAGLSNTELKAMIIPDGYHLPDDFIKLVIKTKDIENVIAVSDISPIAGLIPGKYELWNTAVILEEDGFLHCEDRPCLAGSSSTLFECMNYIASKQISTVEDMLKIAFYNPLNLIGISPETIKGQTNVIWNKDTNRFDMIKN